MKKTERLFIETVKAHSHCRGLRTFAWKSIVNLADALFLMITFFANNFKMKFSLYLIHILLINFTLGTPPTVDPNLLEFKVKIEKKWTQQKEYEYLFNRPIEEAMTLTVYQAKTVPKQKSNGQLELEGPESVSYDFLIPKDWAQSELELSIELKESEQVINIIGIKFNSSSIESIHFHPPAGGENGMYSKN